MKPSRTEEPVASTPNTPEARSPFGEAAALRRSSAHQQHRRDGEDGDGDYDERRPGEVHRAASVSARSPWSDFRQHASTPWTVAAPTIGSSGVGSATGWRMKARVCGPPMPPWKEISSSKAQPSSSSGSKK